MAGVCTKRFAVVFSTQSTTDCFRGQIAPSEVQAKAFRGKYSKCFLGVGDGVISSRKRWCNQKYIFAATRIKLFPINMFLENYIKFEYIYRLILLAGSWWWWWWSRLCSWSPCWSPASAARAAAYTQCAGRARTGNFPPIFTTHYFPQNQVDPSII